MKRTLSIVISICLLFTFGMSQNSAGWTMRTISGRQTTEFSGVRLQLLTGDTLRYRWRNLEAWTMADSVVSIWQTKGEGKIVRSVLLGGIGMGAGGYLVGTVLEGSGTPTYSYGYGGSLEKDDIDWKVVLPIIGVAAGAGLGAIFAPALERTEYQFTSYSKEEKLRVLQALIDGETEAAITRAATKTSQEDIVYLKNGSIIRGNVVEMIPDSVIKVRTNDGNFFVFKTSEVEKMTKADTTEPMKAKTSTTETGINKGTVIDASVRNASQYGATDDGRARVVLKGGIAIPTGAFGETSGDESGAAALGFVAGAGVMFPVDEVASIGVSLSIMHNGIDLGGSVPSSVDLGSWTNVWLMFAGRVNSSNVSSVQTYLEPRIGVLFASAPSISGGGVSAEWSSGTGFAYGGAAGITFSRHVNVEVSYMASKPEFTVTLKGGGSNLSATGNLPINILSISLGFVFW